MESIEHAQMFWYYALEIPSTLLQYLCNANCTLRLLYVPSFMLRAASVDCALVRFHGPYHMGTRKIKYIT
jgi:hypothetical protein